MGEYIVTWIRYINVPLSAYIIYKENKVCYQKSGTVWSTLGEWYLLAQVKDR